MYCTNCGKKITDGNKYCPYCSIPLPEAIHTAKIKTENTGKGKKAGLFAIIAGAVLILVLSAVIGSAVIASIRGHRDQAGRKSGRTTGDAAEQVEPLRDISGESEIYQAAYRDILENMEAIIASYWADGDQIDKMFDSMRGTTEQFHDALRQLDPEIYDVLSDTAAEEAGHNALDSHLIKKGVDAYFSDSEIGRELRVAGETLVLGIMEGLFRYGEDNVRKDLLVALSVNEKYALMRTHGTLANLLEQIRDDSGYNMAIPALKANYDDLFEYYGLNITEEMNIVFNGREGAEEIQEKWDMLNGRLHALEDSITIWEKNMEEWTAAFYADLGLSPSQVNGNEKVYCMMDRDGCQHCFFVEGDISGFRMNPDGRFSYRKGSQTYMRDHDGMILYALEGEFAFSPCGNAFRTTKEEDFQNGRYQILALVRPDGSAQEICRGYDLIVYDCGRASKPNGFQNANWNTGSDGGSLFWAVEYRTLGEKNRVETVVNAKTGRTMSRAAFDEADGAEQIAERNRDFTVINDRYVLKYDTWDLCDGDGIAVLNLADGQGVNSMYYAEESDRYWILSKSGYYYVLDGSLERIREPMKLDGAFWAFTPYGAVLTEGGECKLYDEEGNCLYAFPGNTLWGFIGGKVKSTWWELDLDSRQHDMSYNLNTKEQMFLTFPGTDGD